MARFRRRFRPRFKRRFRRRYSRSTRFYRRKSRRPYGTSGRTKRISKNSYASYNGLGLPERFTTLTRLPSTTINAQAIGVAATAVYHTYSCVTQPTDSQAIFTRANQIFAPYYRFAINSGSTLTFNMQSVGTVGGEWLIFEVPKEFPPPAVTLGNWINLKDIKGAKYGIIGEPGASNDHVRIKWRSYAGKMYRGMKFSFTDFADEFTSPPSQLTTAPPRYSIIYLCFLSYSVATDDNMTVNISGNHVQKVTYFGQNPITVD